MIPPDYRTATALRDTINKQTQTLSELEKSISNREAEDDSWKQKVDAQKRAYDDVSEQYRDACAELSKKQAEVAAKQTEADETVARAAKRAVKMRELYKSMVYALDNFIDANVPFDSRKIPENDLNELEAVSPSVMLKLHCMDMKDLRKAYRDNDKLVTKTLDQYAARYTTKANKAIYSLMVIALRSELQNVLSELKYNKLDKCLADVKAITDKYLKIASDGN